MNVRAQVSAALGLARLAARRSLPPALVLAALVLGTVVYGVAGATGALSGRTARADAWAAFLCLLLPAQGIAAARLAGLWRGRRGSWLLARPISPWATAAGAWLGALAAGALLVGLAAASAELNAARGAPEVASPMRVRARIDAPARTLVEGDPAVEIALPLGREAPAPGAELRLALSSGLGAPSARARVALVRRGEAGSQVEPGARVEREVVVFGRRPMSLPLPAGSGELVLVLEHAGGAPLFLPAGGVELLEPCRGWSQVSLSIALRILLLLAVVDALALGLSSWMRPGIAGALALAALAPAWLDDRALQVLPGTEAFEAIALAGDGFGAAPLGALALARALLAIAVGWTLAATGQREDAP